MPDRTWTDSELDAALAAFRADVDADVATVERLRRRISSAQEASPAQPGRPLAEVTDRGPGRWSHWGIPAAAAAVVVATVTGVTVIGPAGPPTAGVPAPHAAASEARPPEGGTRVPAAELGRAASDPAVGPGQYLYRRTEYAAGAVVEEWVPADRSGVWLLRPTPDNELGGRAAPRGEYFGPRGQLWWEPTQELLAGLPRDPRALADVLQSDAVIRSIPYPDGWDAAAAPDHAALVAVAFLLQGTPVPADLRAALFAAFDLVPGVEARIEDGERMGVLRADRDVPGQEARFELLVDLANGQMSGDRNEEPGSGSSIVLGVADELGVPPAR